MNDLSTPDAVETRRLPSEIRWTLLAWAIVLSIHLMQHSAGLGQIFSQMAEDLPPSMRRTDIGIFFGPIQGLACLVIGVSLLVHFPFQRQIKLIGYACWALVATAVLQALIDANSRPDFMGRIGSLWMSIGNELVQIVPALLGILVWRKYRVRAAEPLDESS